MLFTATPAAALPSSDADDDVPTAAIVGGVFGGVLVIAVIVVIVAVKRKRLESECGLPDILFVYFDPRDSKERN